MSEEILSAELVIQGVPPLPNDRKGAHWGRIAAERAEWRRVSRLIAIDARNRGSLPWPSGRVRLELAFVYPTARMPDVDNAAAAAKPVIDGLVGVLIDDDGPRCVRELRARLVQDPRARSPYMKVKVVYGGEE